MVTRENRKLEHIKYALETGQTRTNGFEDIIFVHRSLPNLSVSDVEMKTELGELSLSSPVFINAMTGGGGEQTYEINKRLATVARECGVAIAVGSQTAAIRDASQRYTYRVVREVNPGGIVFANVGSEITLDEAKLAIEMIEANALQIHLNVIQELVMPEGDRDFTNTLENIEKIVSALDIPVIIKEVGFGMSKEVARSLIEIGVQIIDVGGFGGTNFAKIENKRRNRMLTYFNDWGITTAASLAEISLPYPRLSIIGSGGIQSALDVVKSISLGANAAGFAGYFLNILLESGEEALISEINLIHEDMKLLMTALGAKTITELQKVPLVIKGETYHWLNQRGIDTTKYSNR